MSKRSEFRRLQKNAEKSNQKAVSNIPKNVLYGSQQQVQKDFGLSVTQLKFYLEKMEREIKEDYQKQYQEKLLKSQDYIAVAYVLIAIYAIKLSRKKYEHTKDLVDRFMDNIGEATHYLETVGVEEAYKGIQEEFGIDIEFDSVDINEEFGFGGGE